MSTAFELYQAGPADRVLLSCEHASNALPAPWCWPAADHWLVETHWAWDPGARELSLELADALHTSAVLATFSRLFVDLNRPPESPELCRQQADGRSIQLNQQLGPGARAQRLAQAYEPYHAALNQTTAGASASLLFSIHSFTPLYEGQARELELGILFNQEEALGAALCQHLLQLGYNAVENQPWSGKSGMIYSIERTALAHGRRALELEVRQDLATDPAYRSRLVPALAQWLLSAAARLPSAAARLPSAAARP